MGAPGATELNGTWPFLLLVQLSKLVACVYLPRAWPTEGKQNESKAEKLIR